MAGYGLAVEFKEYKEIDCNISEDTSVAPTFDTPGQAKFPIIYDYVGNKETAEPIKNKFIYIFQKHSDGNAYLNREMKGTSGGKLDLYDISDWENADSRDVKSRGFPRIYFDENSLKNGSLYYFCISRIQWSKERLKVVRNQLKAGNCKRLVKLPIHNKYASHYSDEEKRHVNYVVTESNAGYLLTEVFLTDFWHYVYDEGKGAFKTFKKDYKALEDWLKKKDNGIVRNELRALNEAIWHLCSVGTKRLDWNVIGLHIQRFFMTAHYADLASDPFISQDFLEKWRKDTYDQVFNKVENYSVYRNLLRELNPDKDKQKLDELGRHPRGQDWTDAEYWMMKFSEEKMGFYTKILKSANLLINWMIKKEFVAMQHDYVYGTEGEKSQQSEQYSEVLLAIVQTPPGRVYLYKESDNCLRILDRLKDDERNKNIMIDILGRDLSDTEITEAEALTLLAASEKSNRESSYSATILFSMRKMELGIIQMLQALAALEKPIKRYVERCYFEVVIDDISMAFINRGVANHKICAKMDNWGKTGWWKNKGVSSEADWKRYIEKRYNLKNRSISYEYRSGYIYAIDNEAKANLKKNNPVFYLDEVLEDSKKFKFINKVLDSNLLGTLVITFEVANILTAFKGLADSQDSYDRVANLLSVAGAITDFATPLAEFAGKKATSCILGAVSGILEAGMNYTLGRKRGLLNNSSAEYAYYGAAIGSLAVTVGALLGLSAATGPVGPIVVGIGIAVQLVSSLLASLFTHDDIQTWINHCYWGDSADNGKCTIPSFSNTCFVEWKNNIEVQLEAYNFLVYGFNLDFRSWLNDSVLDKDKLKGSIKVTIVPNILLENSKFKVKIWLEGYRGAKKVLVDDKIIAFDQKQFDEGGIDYIYPYVIKDINSRVKKIIFAWYNSEFELTENHGYWSMQQPVPQNKVDIIDDFGKMMYYDYQYIHIEASLDLYGNGSLVLPGKDSKVVLHKRISESHGGFIQFEAIGLDSKDCGKHEKK